MQTVTFDGVENPSQEFVLEAKAAVRELRKAGLADHILEALNAPWPTPDDRLRGDLASLTRWADQLVKEQALLLEALLLLHFKQPLPLKSIVGVLKLCEKHDMGAEQPLFTYLSSIGRHVVEWVQHIFNLLVIQVLQMRLLDTDQHDMQHPLAGSGHLRELDACFFRDKWNQERRCTPALLAWTTLLSHLRQGGDGFPTETDVTDHLRQVIRFDAPQALFAMLRGLDSTLVPRCATAHKKIVKDLLWALFQSECYNAVSSSSVSLAYPPCSERVALQSVFNALFQGEPTLCSELWTRDLNNLGFRVPLLVDAVRCFADGTNPACLLDMLTALAGTDEEKTLIFLFRLRGYAIQWQLGWSPSKRPGASNMDALPLLLEQLAELSESGAAGSLDSQLAQWRPAAATLRLLAAITHNSSDYLRQVTNQQAELVRVVLKLLHRLGPRVHGEPCASEDQALELAHAAATLRRRGGRQQHRRDARASSEELQRVQRSVLLPCFQLLLAAADLGEEDLTRHILVVLGGSAQDNYMSVGLAPVSSSFAAVATNVLQNVELVQGEYSCTLAALRLLLGIIPNEHRWQRRQLLANETSGPASPYSMVSALSLTEVAGSVDMHALLQFAVHIFMQYDSWVYRNRTQRWLLGADLLQLFESVLSAPASNPYAPAGKGNSSTDNTMNGLSAYLQDMFLHEGAMRQALFNPLIIGEATASRLQRENAGHDAETLLLSYTVEKAFAVVQLLLRAQRTQLRFEQRSATSASAGLSTASHAAANSASGSYGSTGMSSAGTGQQPTTILNAARVHELTSFARAVMECSTATGNVIMASLFPGDPPVARDQTAHCTNLVQCIVTYCNSKVHPLQLPALRTLALLAGSNEGMPSSSALAGHLGHTVPQLVTACLSRLETQKRPQGPMAVLELLAVVFEKQPGLAERFLTTPGGGGSAGKKPARQQQTLLGFLRNQIEQAQQLFEKNPAVLEKCLHIVFSLWASPGYQTEVEKLKNKQKGDSKFWSCVTHCLTVDLPQRVDWEVDFGDDDDDDDDMDDALGSDENNLAESHHRYCKQLLVRSWAMQLIMVELYATREGEEIHANLIEVLNSFLEKIRHRAWLEQYCNVSENTSALRKAYNEATRTGINLATFLSFDSIFCCPDTMHSTVEASLNPVYNTRMLRQLAVDEPQAEKVAQLLDHANRAQVGTDCALVLLRAWIMMVQVSLLKYPEKGLGLSTGVGLAWMYLDRLTMRLAKDPEDSSHEQEQAKKSQQQRNRSLLRRHRMASASTQCRLELSSVLLSLITYLVGYPNPSSSDSSNSLMGGGGLHVIGGNLEHQRVLIEAMSAQLKLARSASSKTKLEGAAKLSAELLSRMEAAVSCCVLQYLPAVAASTAMLQAQVNPESLAASLPSTSHTASLQLTYYPSSDSTRTSDGTSGAMVTSSSTSSSVTLQRYGNSSRRRQKGHLEREHSCAEPEAVAMLQSLLGSYLLMLRFTNNLLSRIAILELAEQTKEGRGGGMAPLDLGSSASKLKKQKPKTQAQVMREIMRNGIDTPALPRLWMSNLDILPALAACLPVPALTDVSLTVLPLALESVSQRTLRVVPKVCDGFKDDPEPQEKIFAVQGLALTVPNLLHVFAVADFVQADVCNRILAFFTVLCLESDVGAELLVDQSLMTFLTNSRALRMPGSAGESSHLPPFAARGSGDAANVPMKDDDRSALAGEREARERQLHGGLSSPSWGAVSSPSGSRGLRRDMLGGTGSSSANRFAPYRRVGSRRGAAAAGTFDGLRRGRKIMRGSGVGGPGSAGGRLHLQQQLQQQQEEYQQQQRQQPGRTERGKKGQQERQLQDQRMRDGFNDQRPYLADGSRNPWHRVWCTCLSLVTHLLRARRGRDHQLVDQVLGFLKQYRGRVHAALDSSRVDHLTLGKLEEVERLTALIYEVEKTGLEWRVRHSELARTHERLLLSLKHAYTQLLRDPSKLNDRALAVSAEEQKRLPKKERRAWGAEGFGDLLDYGAAAAASDHEGGFGMTEVRASLATKGKQISLRRPPSTPTVKRGSSYLLRSPVQVADPLAEIEPPKDPKAGLFSQQVEYDMCQVLRNVLGFVRVRTLHYSTPQPQNAGMSGALDQAQEYLFDRSMRHSRADMAVGGLDLFSASGGGRKGRQNDERPALADLWECATYAMDNLNRLLEKRVAKQKNGKAEGMRPKELKEAFVVQDPFLASSWDAPTETSISRVVTYLAENSLFLLLRHVRMYIDHGMVMVEAAAAPPRPAGADSAPFGPRAIDTMKAMHMLLVSYKDKLAALQVDMKIYVETSGSGAPKRLPSDRNLRSGIGDRDSISSPRYLGGLMSPRTPASRGSRLRSMSESSPAINDNSAGRQKGSSLMHFMANVLDKLVEEVSKTSEQLQTRATDANKQMSMWRMKQTERQQAKALAMRRPYAPMQQAHYGGGVKQGATQYNGMGSQSGYKSSGQGNYVAGNGGYGANTGYSGQLGASYGVQSAQGYTGNMDGRGGSVGQYGSTGGQGVGRRGAMVPESGGIYSPMGGPAGVGGGGWNQGGSQVGGGYGIHQQQQQSYNSQQQQPYGAVGGSAPFSGALGGSQSTLGGPGGRDAAGPGGRVGGQSMHSGPIAPVGRW